MPFLDVVPLRRVPWGLREFTYDAANTGAQVGDLVWCRFGGHRTAAVAWAERDAPPPGVRAQALLEVARTSWTYAPQRSLLEAVAARYATPLPTLLYLYGVVPPSRGARAAALPEPNLPREGLDADICLVEADPGSLLKATAKLASAHAEAGAALVLCPTRRDVQAVAEATGAATYDLDTSRTERAAIWDAVAAGRCRLVAGTAAAAFLPFPSLGGVTVYREGDPAAKAVEARPLLHLRSLAQALAQAYGCRAAAADWAPTPSAAAWARRYGRVARVGSPSYSGNVTLATPPLLSSPSFTADVRAATRQHRLLVLVPRLGEGGMVRCSDCTYVPSCPNCERSMPLSASGKLRCGYCGHVEPTPAACPRCGGTRLQARQPTVATVARKLRAVNPDVGELSASGEVAADAAVLVSSTAAVYQLHLASFSRRVALGFDTLSTQPSLEACHRAYRLVRELAWSGPTTVETRQPSHPSLSNLDDWGKFTSAELAQRARFGLPPAVPVAKLSYDGSSREQVERAAARLAHQLTAAGATVAGSYASPGRSPRRRHRWVLLVPGLEAPAGVDYSQWTIDPDPIDLD